MSLLVNWQRVLCLGGQGVFPEAPLCARARPSTGNRGDTPTSTSCVSFSTLLLSPEKWHFLPKARLIHSWVQGSWFLPPGMYSSKTSIFGESISWFCCLVECGCEIIFSSENGGMVDGREPHSPSAGCGRVRFLGGLHYRYQNDYKFQLSFRNCNSIHYMNCQVLA